MQNVSRCEPIKQSNLKRMTRKWRANFYSLKIRTYNDHVFGWSTNLCLNWPKSMLCLTDTSARFNSTVTAYQSIVICNSAYHLSSPCKSYSCTCGPTYVVIAIIRFLSSTSEWPNYSPILTMYLHVQLSSHSLLSIFSNAYEATQSSHLGQFCTSI